MLTPIPRYVNAKCVLPSLKRNKNSLLEPKYKIVDDSWTFHPTASSIEKLLTCYANLEKEELSFTELNQANGVDSVLERLLNFLEKDQYYLGLLSSEIQKLIDRACYLEIMTIDRIRSSYDLTTDFEFREIRLWLLDDDGEKLMSGFFDTLLVNQRQQTGILLKHIIHQKPFVATHEDKEMKSLALIASDAFKLKKVIAAKIWDASNSFDLASYTFEDLQVFRSDIQAFLKQIQ
jgi:hypothetical protein